MCYYGGSGGGCDGCDGANAGASMSPDATTVAWFDVYAAKDGPCFFWDLCSVVSLGGGLLALRAIAATMFRALALRSAVRANRRHSRGLTAAARSAARVGLRREKL